jgi:hypothetical protein
MSIMGTVEVSCKSRNQLKKECCCSLALRDGRKAVALVARKDAVGGNASDVETAFLAAGAKVLNERFAKGWVPRALEGQEARKYSG